MSVCWLFILAETPLLLAAEGLSLLHEHLLANLNVLFVWYEIELPATNGALLPFSVG